MSNLFSQHFELRMIPPDEEQTVCTGCGATACLYEADGWEETAGERWYCLDCREDTLARMELAVDEHRKANVKGETQT